MKLKASTLLETVYSISIIVICSLVGTLVYSSVIQSNSTVTEYFQKAEIEKIVEGIVVENLLVKENKAYYNSLNIELNTVEKSNLSKHKFILIREGDTLKSPSFFTKN